MTADGLSVIVETSSHIEKRHAPRAHRSESRDRGRQTSRSRHSHSGGAGLGASLAPTCRRRRSLQITRGWRVTTSMQCGFCSPHERSEMREKSRISLACYDVFPAPDVSSNTWPSFATSAISMTRAAYLPSQISFVDFRGRSSSANLTSRDRDPDIAALIRTTLAISATARSSGSICRGSTTSAWRSGSDFP